MLTSAFWGTSAVCLIAVLMVGALVRRWRSARIISDGSGPVTYQGPVQAWVRRPATSKSSYAYLKGGVGSLVLTVREDTISIRHSLFARRFAAVFGLDYTLPTRDLTTDDRDKSMSYGRHALVIHCRDESGPLDLAIHPIDGDLNRLRAALRHDGSDLQR
jgi:hypothetical protein